MNSRSIASTMAMLSMFAGGMNIGRRAHIKEVERTQMKGLSSEEMGTKGKGKKLSRAQRKAKTRKNP